MNKFTLGAVVIICAALLVGCSNRSAYVPQHSFGAQPLPNMPSISLERVAYIPFLKGEVLETQLQSDGFVTLHINAPIAVASRHAIESMLKESGVLSESGTSVLRLQVDILELKSLTAMQPIFNCRVVYKLSDSASGELKFSRNYIDIRSYPLSLSGVDFSQVVQEIIAGTYNQFATDIQTWNNK